MGSASGVVHVVCGEMAGFGEGLEIPTVDRGALNGLDPKLRARKTTRGRMTAYGSRR